MNDTSETFQKALSNFTFDLAARGAIRHLFDLGYDAASIHAQLSFPVPLAQITREIASYQAEKAAHADKTPQYDYVKESDAYGRSSFRRIRRDDS